MPDKSPAVRQRRYERHKTAGRCTSCLRHPALSGKIRCIKCQKKELRRNQAEYQRRIRHGLCPECGKNKPAKNHVRCAKCLARGKTYHQEHREKRLASCRAWQQRLKLEVMTYYSDGRPPSCQCCGEDDLALLVLDHIKNDGKRHRQQVGSLYIYSWLTQHDFPKGFQVLCFNCNMGKQFNGGTECPAHKAHAQLKRLRRRIKEVSHA